MSNLYFSPKHFLTAACICGAMILPVSSTMAGTGEPATAVSTNDLVAGMTYGDWGAAWWQWAVSIPIEDNPLSGSEGTDCSEGQGSSPVFFLGGTFGDEDEVVETPVIVDVSRECAVPAGSYLFFPIINALTHNADEPFAEAAQREDVASLVTSFVDVDSLKVTVDGKKIQGAKNLIDFRAQSPNFTFTLPENNVISDNSGRFDGTADGYWMMLKPLSLGEHEVRFAGNVVVEGEVVFGLDITYMLTVE